MKVIVYKRILFEFTCTEREFLCLTTLNVSNSSNINVNLAASYYNMIDPVNSILSVKILPGDGYVADKCNTCRQQWQFERNLESLGINYTKRRVVQVIDLDNSYTIGTPGVLRRSVAMLVCNNIPMLEKISAEAYIDNSKNGSYVSSIFVVPDDRVSDAYRALKRLNNINERDLCINICNVDQQCGLNGNGCN